MLSLASSSNHLLMVLSLSSFSRNVRIGATEAIGYAYSPTFFLFATVFALVITSAIFQRTFPHKDPNTRITFGDSLALAALYHALSFACLVLLGLIAFYAIASILAFTGR